LVELNSADSLTLIKIRGIKGFYSKKIIEHREELGGYASKEQLMELYKFDKEKFDAVEKYVTVDISKIKKININTCTAKELKHPYLNWNAVNGIISYREKHGKFKNIEDIKKTDLVDDETYRKIAPYLKTE
jgi:competence ComEA-like helix-hairpin-helix protein